VQGSSLRSVRSVRAAALFPLKKEFWIPQLIRVLGPTGGAAESCSAPDCFWGIITSSTMEMGMAIKQNFCCRRRCHCLACHCRLRPLVHAFSSEWTLKAILFPGISRCFTSSGKPKKTKQKKFAPYGISSETPGLWNGIT
jgi:hypothetical protein